MAQLWGGRFTKETDKLVYNFNASISFDQKFYEQDIRGSKAHVAMLARQGILTAEEKDQIEVIIYAKWLAETKKKMYNISKLIIYCHKKRLNFINSVYFSIEGSI